MDRKIYNEPVSVPQAELLEPLVLLGSHACPARVPGRGRGAFLGRSSRASHPHRTSPHTHSHPLLLLNALPLFFNPNISDGPA